MSMSKISYFSLKHLADAVLGTVESGEEILGDFLASRNVFGFESPENQLSVREQQAIYLSDEGKCWVVFQIDVLNLIDIQPNSALGRSILATRSLQGMSVRLGEDNMDKLCNTIFFFGHTSESKLFDHIDLSYYDGAHAVTFGELKYYEKTYQGQEVLKITNWTAPPSTLSYAEAAIGAGGIAIIGDNSIGSKNAFPAKTLKELKTQRTIEWDLHKDKFEFFELDGHSEVHLPHTVTGLMAIPAQTSGDLHSFLTGAGKGGSLTFMQSLSMTMILTNGRKTTTGKEQTYFLCFGVKGPGGHNVYMSFPAGLSNAAIWNATATQYSYWVNAAHTNKNWSKVTVTCKVLQSWGYSNLCVAAQVPDDKNTSTHQILMSHMTQPGISRWVDHYHINILEAIRRDNKKITNAIVAQGAKNAELRAKGQKAEAVKEIPEANFEFYHKSGMPKTIAI